MNAAQLHLTLNHVPVLGTIFGTLVLAVAAARGRRELVKAAFAVLAFSALAALPAFLTGEPAEELVKHIPGVSWALIEAHEDASLAALAAVLAAGAAAAASLWLCRRRDRVPGPLVAAVLGAAVVASVLLARAAHLGGQIRHTEIQRPADGR